MEQVHILKDYESVKPYLREVQSAADSHKKEFGFLSASAYDDAAQKQRLWIAVTNKERQYAGHLMFGGQRNALRVSQLFAAKPFRRARIGHTLISELKSYGEQLGKTTVIARVAAELPANPFWEREGFIVVRQEPGKGAKKRSINIRVLELQTPTLFDSGRRCSKKPQFANQPAYVTDTYVLDVNVVYDLARERATTKGVRNLITAAFQQKLKLYRTHEMVRELERTPRPNDPILELARSIPALPERGEDDLLLLTSSLRTIVFPRRDVNRKRRANDESDLRHIAHCIASNVGTFVTAERAILRAADEIYAKHHLDVRSPVDFENSDTTEERGAARVGVAGQQIHFRPAIATDEEGILALLNTLGVAEAKARKIVIMNDQSRQRHATVACLNGRIRGVLIYDIGHALTSHQNAYLYVDEEVAGHRIIVEHLLHECSSKMPCERMSNIDLYIRPDQMLTRELAMSRGFHPSPAVDTDVLLTKPAIRTPIAVLNWNKIVREFRRCTGYDLPAKCPSHEELVNTGMVLHKDDDTSHTMSLYDFETMLSPSFLIVPRRKGVIIPITHEYAQHLLSPERGQLPLDLFSTSSVQGMLERAYFRKPVGHRRVSHGMRMFFYVSRRSAGGGVLQGMARCTCSKVVLVDQALLEFSRQGVLDRAALAQIADKNGNVHIIAFDSVFPLPRKIPMKELKSEGIVSDANMVTLQTINSDQTKRIMQLGGLLRDDD